MSLENEDFSWSNSHAHSQIDVEFVKNLENLCLLAFEPTHTWQK